MSLSYHRLPLEVFDAMAAGGGGRTAADFLKRLQHSKHALLLLGVVTGAETTGHPQAPLARRGYELLADAERRDPAAAALVIRHSSVGAWAHRTAAALRNGTHLPGAVPGGLAGVAAAAAVRAGLEADIDVPVTDGFIMLPSLGAAGPADAEAGSVRYRGGRVEVSAGNWRAVIPGDPRTGATGWRPLRELSLGPARLLVDDVDPFRMPAAPHLAPSADAGRWSPVFRDAWTVLEEHHPVVAEEVTAMIKVVVPLLKPARGQVSSSSPETFGAVALSEPAEALTLASTLTHEVQHVKLAAVLDLIPMTRPDDGGRFYAPWREDPRPVSGLLQGAYAYLGVTGFWRRQREMSDGIDAHAQFARWREAAALVAATLLGCGRLTAHGERFVRGMATTLRAWQDDPVPQAAQRVADEECARHQARWQEQHGMMPVS